MSVNRLLIAFALMTLLCACDKAPRGIIKESDMVDLLVDLYKADAYVESYPMQFPDDSTRMLLKQSVYSKHGITQADYDTSLVWYAHNMDAYTDVYRRVIDRLDADRDKIDMNAAPSRTAVQRADERLASTRRRAANGDSTDLWTQQRTWLITQGLHTGFIPFDVDLDDDCRLGDRYELRFKVAGWQRALMAVVAADYSDGGTAFVRRNAMQPGWNGITLQTDSLRSVKRLYGYVKFQIPPHQMASLDSVQLLRTHLDASQYLQAQQRVTEVERNVRHNTHDAVDGKQNEQQPAQKRPLIVTERSYKPKEGLNKSSTRPHIDHSPNERHMPHHNP